MGGKGGSTRTTQGLRGAAGRRLGTGLSNLLSTNPAQRQQGLAAFLLDPAQYQQIGQSLGQTAFGGYLDVANAPTSKALTDALTAQSNLNLGQNLAGLRGRFALSGQPSTGASSPLLQAQKQAIVQSQTGLDATLANQLFGLYGDERARQLAGLGALTAYQRTPEDILANLAPYFSRAESRQRSGGLFGFLGK